MGPRAKSALVAMTVGAGTGAGMLAVLHVRWPQEVPPPPAAGEAPTDRHATEPPAPAGAASGPASPREGPCPDDMALVDGLECPSLEYTCARKSDYPGHGCAEWARGARCTEPVRHRRYCIDRHEWPNRVGEAPQVYVDWHEAKALCRSVDKRLCARSEWTLACEGPKRLPYPWGFTRWPSPCNIDRPTVPFDASAIDREDTRETELARLWQADPIGSHPSCVSAYGVYDLTGNVDEWTDDTLDDPTSPHPSTLSGGYWGPVRNTCRLTTTSHGPSFKFYQVGFRCCADAVRGEG